MKLIPFERFTIKSDKNESELIYSLTDNIEQKKHFRLKRNNIKPYEGKIENNSFKINRIIYYRNPFLPVIKGKLITQNHKGTDIKIIIRIKYFILLFMLFWSFGPTLFFINFPPETIIAPLIISVVWITIGYLFLFLPFNFERNKSKEFLTELLNSNVITSNGLNLK
jgi:hypothetical protein